MYTRLRELAYIFLKSRAVWMLILLAGYWFLIDDWVLAPWQKGASIFYVFCLGMCFFVFGHSLAKLKEETG